MSTSLNNILEMEPLPDMMSSSSDIMGGKLENHGIVNTNVIKHGSLEEKYEEYVKRIFRWSVYRNYSA